jgi:hypothetical protein
MLTPELSCAVIFEAVKQAARINMEPQTMAPWRRLKDHSTHCQRILHAESMELPRSKL